MCISFQAKEITCLEKFDQSRHVYKKSRNPCNGELTPRDDAEYLIPFEKLVKDKMITTTLTRGSLMYHETKSFQNATMGDTNKMTLLAKSSVKDVSLLDTIRRKREDIDNEIAQMKRVAQYKQYCLQHQIDGLPTK